MSDRYQVKFPWKGETRFGIVDSFGEEAETLAKQGKLLVEDAVLPQRYAVPDDKSVVDVPDSMDRYEFDADGFVTNGDEYCMHVQEEYKKALAVSDALPEGVHVGKMFSIGVADGIACYVVTKVNKKTCVVEWRGFENLDRYRDHFFGWGRTVPIADAARYIGVEEGMKKLYAKKKATRG